jgi:hypothetical protein
MKLEPLTHEDIEKFNSLANQWEKDTRYFSNFPLPKNNVSAQQLVAMGPKIIPLIYQKLVNDEGCVWGFFQLLKIFTDRKIDLHPDDDGIYFKIKNAWINLLTKEGYID